MAFAFKEADRVPIEVRLTPFAENYPKAQRLVGLVNEYSDNLRGIGNIDWGFFGVPAKFEETPIESENEYLRSSLIYETPFGSFKGIVDRDTTNPSYWNWKKHYINDITDLEKLANAEFPEIQVIPDYLSKLDEACGDKYLPTISVHRPFGQLARISPPDEFYAWLYTERELIHKLFEKQYQQINNFIKNIKAPVVFYFTALEMAVPPWLSRDMFDEFIYKYDVEMNANIHKYGGIVRHHAHDKIFSHLEHWADMGIDSIEPLEMPPAGDTDLAEAKKLLGNRMSLAGNIPSQFFITLSNEEIDRMVLNAITAAAKGGGFILKCASTVCGMNSFKNLEQLDRMIEATECFIDSGLKYGRY